MCFSKILSTLFDSLSLLLTVDLKQIHIHNDERAVKFENSMQYKIGVLTMALMSRNKQGGQAANFLALCAKHEDDADPSARTGSVFKSFLLCPEWSVTNIISKEPELLSKLIEDLLETSRDAKMGSLLSENFLC